MCGHHRRANSHAAELRHFEDHIVSANAVRPIQGGPFGRQADDHGQQQHRHKQNQSRQTAKKNIEGLGLARGVARDGERQQFVLFAHGGLYAAVQGQAGLLDGFALGQVLADDDRVQQANLAFRGEWLLVGVDF